MRAIARAAVLTGLLALGASGAQALVIGGTNMDLLGYPAEKCIKPSKPFKPYSLASKWEVDSYNSEVEIYNSALNTYVRCVRTYLDNAKADIERIQERMQEAVDRFKRDY